MSKRTLIDERVIERRETGKPTVYPEREALAELIELIKAEQVLTREQVVGMLEDADDSAADFVMFVSNYFGIEDIG